MLNRGTIYYAQKLSLPRALGGEVASLLVSVIHYGPKDIICEKRFYLGTISIGILIGTYEVSLKNLFAQIETAWP